MAGGLSQISPTITAKHLHGNSDIEATLDRFDDYTYGKPLTIPNRLLDAISKQQGPQEGRGENQEGDNRDGGHNRSVVVNTGGEDRPLKMLTPAMKARAAGGSDSNGKKRSSGSGSTKRTPRASGQPKKSGSGGGKKKSQGSRAKGKGRMAKSMLGG